MMYGYPTVTNYSIQKDEPYLCVSHDTGKAWVQPLRLLAGFVGGPVIMAASRYAPGRLGQATFAAGLGMSIWSLAIYRQAKKEMDKHPDSAQYGHVPRRHFRKVDPWLRRLETATAALQEDMESGNRLEALRSLEDVWFWVGRSMGEILASGQEIGKDPQLSKRVGVAMRNAGMVSAAAQEALR